MANECALYYARVINQLTSAGINDAADMFWAGVFAGICEQVMMKVKPAGMIGAEVTQADSIATLVASVYRLHKERLDKPTGGYEIWVCRSDDPATLADITHLKQGNLDWGQYHALRGRLCGYSDAVIRNYTEGVWP